jgi:hypothetical protein
VAVPREQPGFTGLDPGEDAITVALELEDPARTRERPVGGLREHQQLGIELYVTLRRAKPGGFRGDRGGRSAPLLQLLDGEAGQHRLLRQLGRGRDMRVALLDEEPLLLALLDLYERPAAVQLEPFQIEQKLAFRETFARIADGGPPAAVPHDDTARSVVAGRNDALEVAVLQRMILDVHGEPLVGRVERRSLGHGPGHEHAVELEAEIVVQMARGMLVNHEELASGLGPAARRLGRSVELALRAVVGEEIVGRRNRLSC